MTSGRVHASRSPSSVSVLQLRFLSAIWRLILVVFIHKTPTSHQRLLFLRKYKLKWNAICDLWWYLVIAYSEFPRALQLTVSDWPRWMNIIKVCVCHSPATEGVSLEPRNCRCGRSILENTSVRECKNRLQHHWDETNTKLKRRCPHLWYVHHTRRLCAGRRCGSQSVLEECLLRVSKHTCAPTREGY